MFTRLMRDYGFDFLHYDKHTQNLFARGFEFHDEKIEAITCFECFEHFVNPHPGGCFLDATFGVMQPVGDRWGDTPASRKQYGENRGAYIDRIAGSPWFGREWVKRAYGGNGPMFAGYRHMYADEELLEVATKLGVYWPRRDLIQLHQHWGRRPGDEFATMADCPDFLHQVNTPQHWHESQKIFVERKAAGWPGHEPLLTSVSA